MAEQNVQDEHAEIKKRAMRRLIFAGALVTAAVVTLTVLSHKPEKSPEPITTAVAPKPALPEPVTPEPVVEAAPEAVPGTPPDQVVAAPDSEAAPALPPPPPPPQVINHTAQSTTAPATAKPRTEAAAAQPAASQPRSDAASAKANAPQSITISATPAPAKQVEHPAPPSNAAASPAPPPAKTVESAAPKAYVVQLGIFANHENALQLQKRLAEHGIKSYTETRLHVGPFKDKADADAAMSRIRSLGINAVLAPSR